MIEKLLKVVLDYVERKQLALMCEWMCCRAILAAIVVRRATTAARGSAGPAAVRTPIQAFAAIAL
jgi:hypothetical protein